MQTEFIAYYGAAAPAIWLKNLITELQIVHFTTKPLTIYYDNRAAVFFTKNNNQGFEAHMLYKAC